MFKMDKFEPLNPYQVVRFKRNRHEPLHIGDAVLYWVPEDGSFVLDESGHWYLTNKDRTIGKHLPENIDRATLNRELESWVAEHGNIAAS